ncbi:CRISPR-associated endonuclease Cas2 [Planctomycetota bacterium]|nr:CRISPR-associated endonuclease Cas2 [Planctomycetota bacterium]
MWILVMFDLPVRSKPQRKRATGFRKHLLESGFQMVQFSIYTRPCASEAIADRHSRDVRAALPPEGSVQLMRITDRQFERIERFLGKSDTHGPTQPKQLEFF